MNNVYCTKKKEKNKHLTKEMYEKIQSKYNHFLAAKESNSKKTIFMKQLASSIGTTLSNLYEIIKVGMITVLDSDYNTRIEFNANTACNKRTKKSVESNSSKRKSSKPFIDLVVKEYRSKYNINSIDEIINDFKINRTDEIEGFTKHELPMKCKRKSKNEKKEGKTDPKGTSIDNRPFNSEDRSEFGHWEGDTIVGSRTIPNGGAVFTLVERKTRFQITIKCKDGKALTIYKAVKKIKKKYPELKDYKLSDIFKSITFDNGVKFSKWEEIEKYLKTKCYFAHPYSSYERGSNENGNRLLRLFLPKGYNINEYTDNHVMDANELINTKIRKILNYKSSLELFNIELAKLTRI